jgi:hypothetical protein
MMRNMVSLRSIGSRASPYCDGVHYAYGTDKKTIQKISRQAGIAGVLHVLRGLTRLYSSRMRSDNHHAIQ